MGKKQHLFTPWFRLSIEKVNSTDREAACRSCIKANPNPNISQKTHPADDQNAKWKMENLFVEDLEPPFYYELL